MRDCFPVGAVRASLYLPLGYTKALGATVLRADYPRLVRLADEQELWTDDPVNNPGLFGVGDGVTTFVLPNWTDRMVQLTAAGAGAALAAGLPNITSDTITTRNGYIWPVSGSNRGLISGEGTELAYIPAPSETSPKKLQSTIKLDASTANLIYGNSNTVQPPAIKMIPIMRY